jgi:hypothetical protein
MRKLFIVYVDKITGSRCLCKHTSHPKTIGFETFNQALDFIKEQKPNYKVPYWYNSSVEYDDYYDPTEKSIDEVFDKNGRRIYDVFNYK